MKTWTNSYFAAGAKTATENFDITDSLGGPGDGVQSDTYVPAFFEDDLEPEADQSAQDADSLGNIASSLESLANTLAVDGVIAKDKIYYNWINTVLSHEGMSATDVPELFSVSQESISLEAALETIKKFFAAAYEAIVSFLKKLGAYFKKAYEWIKTKFNSLKMAVEKKKDEYKRNAAKNSPGRGKASTESLGTYSKEDSGVVNSYRLVLSPTLAKHIHVYGNVEAKNGEELVDLAERCQTSLEGVFGHVKGNPLSHIREAVESLHGSLNSIKQASGSEDAKSLFWKFESDIKSAASSLGIGSVSTLSEIYTSLKSELEERSKKTPEAVDLCSRSMIDAMDKIVSMVGKDLSYCSDAVNLQNKLSDSIKNLANQAKMDALESEGIYSETHSKRVGLFKEAFQRINQTKTALMIGQFYYTRLSRLYDVMTELAVIEPIAA